MKVLVIDNGDGTAWLVWPAGRNGRKDPPTHEMADGDVRFLERLVRPLRRPKDVDLGRQLALFRWADIEPMLTELDG